MLLNKQYKSVEKAPPYPLKTCRQENSLSDALTSAATAVVGLLHGDSGTASAAMSLGKRARVSSQYLEHLEKLHESGILSVCVG